jgi:hypothetical protein
VNCDTSKICGIRDRVVHVVVVWSSHLRLRHRQLAQDLRHVLEAVHRRRLLPEHAFQQRETGVAVRQRVELGVGLGRLGGEALARLQQPLAQRVHAAVGTQPAPAWSTYKHAKKVVWFRSERIRLRE